MHGTEYGCAMRVRVTMKDMSLKIALALTSLVAVHGCHNKTRETRSANSPSASHSARPAGREASIPSARETGNGGSVERPAAPDASDAKVLTLVWSVRDFVPTLKLDANVAVSVTIDGESTKLEALSGISDEPPSGIATCTIGITPASSQLECGFFPKFAYYDAQLKEGTLTIRRIEGGYGDDSEQIIEGNRVVLSRPSTATGLSVSGPGIRSDIDSSCGPGFVKRTTYDGACVQTCPKKIGCKATEVCKLIDVQGAHRPHKMSACVPKS
jgi:hypothetical protein